MRKATIRTIMPQQRKADEASDYWKGTIHIFHYDGKILDVTMYDGQGRPGAHIYCGNRESALFRLFLAPAGSSLHRGPDNLGPAQQRYGPGNNRHG